MRVFFVFHYPVNWDEFFYLSQIYDFIEGRLTKPLQYGHVFLFAWVDLVPGNEIGQIIVLRLVMSGLQIATAFFIYGLGRLFFSDVAAAFSAFLYITVSYVIWQGASFRADPIAIFMLMGALLLLLGEGKRDRESRNIVKPLLAGVLIGMAGAVTIKSIFVAVPVGIILFLYWWGSNEELRQRQWFYALLIVIAAAIATFGLYLFVMTQFVVVHSQGGDVVPNLLNSLDIFMDTQSVSGWKKIFALATGNPVFAIFLLISLVFVVGMFWSKEPQAFLKPSVLLALLLPLCSLFIYRNSFEYYYVFILAPVSIICGAAIDGFHKQLKPSLLRGVLITAIILLGWQVYTEMIQRSLYKNAVLTNQAEMIEVVHAIFPEPVPYIDRCGMISRYPKAGFFMSGAGFIGYNEGYLPDFKSIILEQKPQFIIGATAMPFAGSIEGREIFHYDIKDEDRLFISEHYLPHWRQLYVAGKHFSLTENLASGFDMVISGYYTIESEFPVYIDRVLYTPGQVIALEEGRHIISLASGKAQKQSDVTLRWGDHILRPQEGRDESFPLFSGF